MADKRIGRRLSVKADIHDQPEPDHLEQVEVKRRRTQQTSMIGYSI
jgi:hypothetical protein